MGKELEGKRIRVGRVGKLTRSELSDFLIKRGQGYHNIEHLYSSFATKNTDILH